MKKVSNLEVVRGVGLDAAVTSFEKWFCWWALERNGFNQSRAAKELKIHRNSLVNRLREWGWAQEVHARHCGEEVAEVELRESEEKL